MDFYGWKIDLADNLTPYLDIDKKKVVFLSTPGDVLEGFFRLDEDGNLFVTSNRSTPVTFLGEKHVKINFCTLEVTFDD